MVIAGFAKEVEEVKRIPPNIQSGTYLAIISAFSILAKIIQSKPAVAITSDTNRLEPLRMLVDVENVGAAKMKFAAITPVIAPISCPIM